MMDEKKSQSEYVFLPKYAFSTASENKPTKMSETPETDNCVKENKHIRFLEEDHWSLNGKFTYTHPIVALCRRLERQRDGLKSAVDCESDLLYAAIAERDEARSRFNEIDLCKNGQAPCKWSLKLIDERDTAIAEREVLLQAIRNLRDTKGRYHTQQAFEFLMTLLPTD